MDGRSYMISKKLGRPFAERIKHVCQGCGKEQYLRPDHARKRKYCSRLCAAKVIGAFKQIKKTSCSVDGCNDEHLTPVGSGFYSAEEKNARSVGSASVRSDDDDIA